MPSYSTVLILWLQVINTLSSYLYVGSLMEYTYLLAGSFLYQSIPLHHYQ